jgi:hypothetical protein
MTDNSDDLSILVNDCMRIVLVMIVGHIARQIFSHSSLFEAEFVNSFFYFIIGTVIYHLFFRKWALNETLPKNENLV